MSDLTKKLTGTEKDQYISERFGNHAAQPINTMTAQQLLTSEQYTEILEHGLDKMRDGVGVDQHASDLHNELYNMDYFTPIPFICRPFYFIDRRFETKVTKRISSTRHFKFSIRVFL